MKLDHRHWEVSFGALRKLLPVLGKLTLTSLHYILSPEVLPALSTCQSLWGKRRAARLSSQLLPSFSAILSLVLDQAHWLSVHFPKEPFTGSLD